MQPWCFSLLRCCLTRTEPMIKGVQEVENFPYDRSWLSYCGVFFEQLVMGCQTPPRRASFPISVLPHLVRFAFCALDDFQTITALRVWERSQESKIYRVFHPLPSGLQLDHIQICVPHELDVANLALHWLSHRNWIEDRGEEILWLLDPHLL
jgi:hypothetical protein